jgi:hypothetical protein
MKNSLLFTLLLLPPAASPAFSQATQLDEGYRRMYNLEFDAAHITFAEWERTHPEDPLGPVSDAAAYLFAEFDRLHILQSELFVRNESFLKRRDLTPDPAVKRKFEAALLRSRILADKVLGRAPRDDNAQFATVMRLGLHADYLALIEKRYLASLSDVKSGRQIAEQLLARNATYYDAYLAIGVENYMLSLKPAPVRWILRIGGAQTDKDEGIRKLRLTAEKGRYLLPYARLLLAVAALRDHDRGRARILLGYLSQEFPRNPLYAEELSKLN